MTPSFSVVVIARNEALTLPRLASSLAEFKSRGGEMILVDTGSTDGTPDVARNLGFRVEEVADRFMITIDDATIDAINKRFVAGADAPVISHFNRFFDFASARNFAASLASNDMISMPDCDEAFTALHIDMVDNFIKAGVGQLEYDFVFSHDENGLPMIEFKHCKFYDRTQLHWVGIIHEVLQGSAKREYLPPAVIKLEHWQNEKTDRSGYLRGLALDCYLHPENDRNSHYFARELYYTGRYSSAIEEFYRHVAMGGWNAERSQSHIYIGECLDILGMQADAVAQWHTAFAIESGRRAPLIRLAEFYRSKNDFQRTAAYAEAALSIKQGNFYSDEAAHYRHIPHELLYWAYWYLDQRGKSTQHFYKAFEFAPDHPKFLHDLRFYEDLPMISIILPTLNKRPEGLQRVKDSIANLTYPQDKIELIVIENKTVPVAVAEGFTQSKGDYIVFASDDIAFAPDSVIRALRTSQKRGMGLVAFNTGEILPDEGNICEHFLISRPLVSLIGGEIFSTKLSHVGCDNLLWAQAKKRNHACRDDSAKVEHFHFSTGKSENDETYQIGWANAEKDRAILKAELQRLEL